MMLQGLTVQYLLRRLHLTPKAGDTILWHAAAGGVGLIACQWAKALGVNLIGTVSSEEKAQLAKEHGAAHTILYTKEDFVARVNEITGGKKVPVVYDSVGKDTFLKSLDCLQPRGLLVLFGNSSGPVDAAQHRAARGEGLALRDAPDAHGLRRRSARSWSPRPTSSSSTCARAKSRSAPRQQYALKDAGAGAPRPRGAQDHRLHHPRAVNARRVLRGAAIVLAVLALAVAALAIIGGSMGLFAGKRPAGPGLPGREVPRRADLEAQLGLEHRAARGRRALRRAHRDRR